MTTRGKRRLRGLQEKDRAHCPFTVTGLSAPSESQERTRKRKRDDLAHDQRQLLQTSPFKPKGTFATHETMDVAYDVEPRKKWFDMTRYKSFIYNGVKYHVDDYVCVTNDTTIKHQSATGMGPEHQGPPKLTDYWVARILEIRALDADNVFARVFWMYSPDELPPNTLTNEDFVSGRQLYHGQHELIASNHKRLTKSVDIINVVSVAMPAIVNHWLESEDEATQGALYWRQAFDCLTSELSPVELVCKCRIPANPDRMLVGCSNPECENWLHYECLLHELLTRVYDDLGTEKPHYAAESPAKAVSATKVVAKPCPSKLATSELDKTQSPAVVQGRDIYDPVLMEQIHGRMPGSTGSPHPGTALQVPTENESDPALVSTRSSKGTRHAYEGLFQPRLDLESVPTVWEILDLRSNVSGGDHTWTENVNCLRHVMAAPPVEAHGSPWKAQRSGHVALAERPASDGVDAVADALAECCSIARPTPELPTLNSATHPARPSEPSRQAANKLLPLLRLRDWHSDRQYDKNQPDCIRYDLCWKPRAVFWETDFRPRLESLLGDKEKFPGDEYTCEETNTRARRRIHVRGDEYTCQETNVVIAVQGSRLSYLKINWETEDTHWMSLASVDVPAQLVTAMLLAYSLSGSYGGVFVHDINLQMAEVKPFQR
ncbi:hypothetical protein Purlil1_12394 [Purpureocillium lilacinum]|uniref:BAH domain-containing protein n=1 Tax=Purpureocillium lilacinum TaxID=33203 RepID=A0ABR0BH04_PURLI|nr:hypothetical protein Purlil1_12394 [Purpureocillium lilacinum]